MHILWNVPGISTRTPVDFPWDVLEQVLKWSWIVLGTFLEMSITPGYPAVASCGVFVSLRAGKTGEPHAGHMNILFKRLGWMGAGGGGGHAKQHIAQEERDFEFTLLVHHQPFFLSFRTASRTRSPVGESQDVPVLFRTGEDDDDAGGLPATLP